MKCLIPVVIKVLVFYKTRQDRRFLFLYFFAFLSFLFQNFVSRTWDKITAHTKQPQYNKYSRRKRSTQTHICIQKSQKQTQCDLRHKQLSLFAGPSVEAADWRAMWHVPMGCASPVHLIRHDLSHFLKYLIFGMRQLLSVLPASRWQHCNSLY